MKQVSIEEIIDTYYDVTGITSFYVDVSFEIKYRSNGLSLDQIQYLGYEELIQYIKVITSEPERVPNAFYTFYTQNHCIYNLVFHFEEDQFVGVFISGAMAIPGQNQQISAILRDNDKKGLHSNMMEILSKVILVSYGQISSLGKILASYVNTYFSDVTYQQFFSGDGLRYRMIDRNIEHKLVRSIIEGADETGYFPIEYYHKLKSVISTGDIEGMDILINSFGRLPLDKILCFQSIDSLRILCVAASVSSLCFAVDAGAPYYQLSEINALFLKQVEEINNEHQIILLMKKILTTYTQVVAVYSYHSYSKPVKQAMKYIQENVNKKISLQELADLTGYSSFYLSTILKKETGLSLSDNINKIRIEQSKILLTSTDMSIFQVAQTVGFAYQNHFTSIFKKMVGITPSEYRNSKY